MRRRAGFKRVLAGFLSIGLGQSQLSCFTLKSLCVYGITAMPFKTFVASKPSPDHPRGRPGGGGGGGEGGGGGRAGGRAASRSADPQRSTRHTVCLHFCFSLGACRLPGSCSSSKHCVNHVMYCLQPTGCINLITATLSRIALRGKCSLPRSARCILPFGMDSYSPAPNQAQANVSHDPGHCIGATSKVEATCLRTPES